MFHSFQEKSCCLQKCDAGVSHAGSRCCTSLSPQPCQQSSPHSSQALVISLLPVCLLDSLALGPASFCVAGEQIGLDCSCFIHLTSETHAPGDCHGPWGTCRLSMPQQAALPPLSLLLPPGCARLSLASLSCLSSLLSSVGWCQLAGTQPDRDSHLGLLLTLLQGAASGAP